MGLLNDALESKADGIAEFKKKFEKENVAYNKNFNKIIESAKRIPNISEVQLELIFKK